MKVSFPSYSENERFARVAVSGFLTQLDPQIDELADVKTAVSEGVTKRHCPRIPKHPRGDIHADKDIREQTRLHKNKG